MGYLNSNSTFRGMLGEHSKICGGYKMAPRHIVRLHFVSNLLCRSNTLLRVAERGSSSHFRKYLDAIPSNVSQIHVLDISETVNSRIFLTANNDCIKEFCFSGAKQWRSQAHCFWGGASSERRRHSRGSAPKRLHGFRLLEWS